jgi:hypothetical protein
MRVVFHASVRQVRGNRISRASRSASLFVKYKHIPSMLHNFGHSFVSLTNYVDDEYAIDLLPALLRGVPDRYLQIRFPSMRTLPDVEIGSTLRKSVAAWAEWLPEHMASHGIAAEALPEIARLLFLDAHGLRCRVSATDDRGKRYDICVP